MNPLQKLLAKIDAFQRRHKVPGFIYAVIKKYGDDQASYQAALLTYYSFLSIFPLLMILTTVLTLFLQNNTELQATILGAVTDYFPVLGDQLSANVGQLGGSGLALFFGIALTLYGARGAADAFRNGVNHIWRVPLADRTGFPKAVGESLAILLIAGAGLVFASLSATIAGSAPLGPLSAVASLAVYLFILFGLFSLVLKITIPEKLPLRTFRAGAATAAVGIFALQVAGVTILSNQLSRLDALYSYFAVSLGLLFWLYLQAQVIYYAIEITSVRANRLYPRSMRDEDLTEADRRALSSQATKERVLPAEREHIKAKIK